MQFTGELPVITRKRKPKIILPAVIIPEEPKEKRIEEVMAAFDKKVTDFKPTVFMRSMSTVAGQFGFYKEEEIGKLRLYSIKQQTNWSV